MTTELAVLSPEQRAEQALGFADTRSRLAELAGKSVRIVEITGKPGYDECHAARMQLKNTRVEIKKRGKEAREDATKFSKAVIAKEKELIDIIEPEEARLGAIQDAWDAARAAEKAERERIERERVAAIQARITTIQHLPVALVGKGVADIDAAIEQATAFDTSEFAGEQQLEADQARTDTLQKLVDMRISRVEFDAEQVRLSEERAELARRLAEQDEADRVAQARRDEDDRLAAEERRKVAAAEAERTRIAAEDRRKQEDQERAERDRQEAEARAERDRAQAEEDARRAADAQRLAEERAELERQRAAEAATERRRAIAAATLKGAATEARERLIELGDADTLLVAKLAKVLNLELQGQAA